jgi:hypothetical protein
MQDRLGVGHRLKDRVERHNKTKAFLRSVGFRSLEEYVEHRVRNVKPDDNECWEWLFSKRDDGYGQLVVGRNHMGAHRFALGLKLGRPLKKSEHACHKCDNPGCWNPNHLFVGSHSDNMRDMVKKERYGSFKPLPPYLRRAIRELAVLGYNFLVICQMLNVSYPTVKKIAGDINFKAIEAKNRELEENGYICKTANGSYDAG